MFSHSGKLQRGGEYTEWLQHRIRRMITTQQVKYGQIKRKQTCSVFCKIDKIPRQQVQDHSKEFLGNNNNKKDFLEKPLVKMIIT